MKIFIDKGIFFFILAYGWVFAQPAVEQRKLSKNTSSPFLSGFSSSLSDFDVLHYRLDLRFPLVSSRFKGAVVLTIRSGKNDLNEITLNSVNLNVDSVSTPNQPVLWSMIHDGIRIRFLRNFAEGDTFSVRIVYNGSPQEKGFYFYPRCAYTFSEPEEARCWFPCHDVPWDKAAAELRVTVPNGVTVASIGLLHSRSISRDKSWETFHWETKYPVSTYLVCLAMSPDYAKQSSWFRTAQGDSLELAYYILRQDSAKAVSELVHMPDALEFFSREFGPYPFEKVGMAEVDPFRYGGMEHQTMITFNSIWLRADWSYESGFVHELSHMWWGDAVTLKNWPDIWLNEGFATYSEALFVEFFYGEAAFRETIRSMVKDYFDQADTLDFPVYGPPEGELFNGGIVYCKGGLVLHMLRKTVGETAFRKILREYFSTYRYVNASTEDFLSVCARNSNKNIPGFFHEWIYSKGFPEIVYLSTVLPQSPDGVKVYLQIQQVQPSGSVFHLPIDLRMAGIKDTVLQISRALERFVFTLPRAPDSLVLDPDGWLTAKITKGIYAVRETGSFPDQYTLYPCFPNPFNEGTTIYYDVPQTAEAEPITLTVFDILGKPVRTLSRTVYPLPGKYQTIWDGRDTAGKKLPSGVYILKMTLGSLIRQQKMVLNR